MSPGELSFRDKREANVQEFTLNRTNLTMWTRRRHRNSCRHLQQISTDRASAVPHAVPFSPGHTRHIRRGLPNLRTNRSFWHHMRNAILGCTATSASPAPCVKRHQLAAGDKRPSHENAGANRPQETPCHATSRHATSRPPKAQLHMIHINIIITSCRPVHLHGKSLRHAFGNKGNR